MFCQMNVKYSSQVYLININIENKVGSCKVFKRIVNTNFVWSWMSFFWQNVDITFTLYNVFPFPRCDWQNHSGQWSVWFPPMFQVFIVFRIFYQIQVELSKKLIFCSNREQLDCFLFFLMYIIPHTSHSNKCRFRSVNIYIRSNGLKEQV